MMTKGEIIRRLREEADMSQTELARKIGTTKQNIYKYENGIVTNIPSNKIEAIADIFNVSPDYIMGWNTDDKRSYYNISVTFHEKDVIEAYRQKPGAVQAMVDKMLDVAPVNTNQTFARVAAFGGGTKDVPPPKVSEEEIERLVEEAEQEEMLAEIEAEKRRKGK